MNKPEQEKTNKNRKGKTQEIQKDVEAHTFAHMEIPFKTQNWKP